MAYYNTVLLPPEDLAPQIVGYAENFVTVADGYLLSQKVLPHVTVCQFETDDVVPEFNVVRSALIKFTGFNMRTGTGIHDGYTWFEKPAVKTQELISLQKEVAGILIASGIKPITRVGEGYHPHLTFCRVKKEEASAWDNKIPAMDFDTGETAWRFAVGASDSNGQLLEIL